MAVSLKKGNKVSLEKVAVEQGITNLETLLVGLGWDVNGFDTGADNDLDAQAWLVGEDGKCRSETDMVFYNSKKIDAQGHKCDDAESVVYLGDNRTGKGDGDDETIIAYLGKIPDYAAKVVFTATIHDQNHVGLNFGQVENAYIHIADKNTGVDLINYDLDEDYSNETAVVVGEIYRHNGEWKFNPIGKGFTGGLAALCDHFGVCF